MTEKQFAIPLMKPDVKNRKAQFFELNEFVKPRNG
jgi:hypothetical protein